MFKLTLLIAFICLFASNTCFNANAAKKKAVWQDLLVHDCNKGLHFMPSSPMGGSMDATPILTVLDFILKEVKDRIGCTDQAKATKRNALCRYIPSLEMALYNFGQHYNKTDHVKMTDSYDGFPRSGFFDNSFPVIRDFQGLGMALMGGLIPTGVKIDVESVLPHTCNPLDFLNGKPCNVQVDLSGALGVKIGFSAQQCSNANAYAPFFSISCNGKNCDKIWLPCLSDSECGSQAKCMGIVEDLFRPDPAPDKSAGCCVSRKYRANKDKKYENYETERRSKDYKTEEACLKANSNCWQDCSSGSCSEKCEVMQHMKPMDSPYDGHEYEKLEWTSGYICYSGQGAITDEDLLHFLKDIGMIAEKDIQQLLDSDKCQVDNDSSKLSFAWRFIYKIQKFIRKTLFKVDAPFKPQRDGEFKFCMPNMVATNKTKWPEQFSKMYFEGKWDVVKAMSAEDAHKKYPNDPSRHRDEIGLWRFFKPCQQKSNGKCGLYDVGNFVCNPSCNIKECHWDGGDCNMPDGKKILEINKDTDKSTYKAFVLDVTRDRICTKAKEEEKDGEMTGIWKEECEIIDDSESPLNYVKRHDEDLGRYREAWREAHKKCSHAFGNYNYIYGERPSNYNEDEVNGQKEDSQKCCIGHQTRSHSTDSWFSKTRNKNITCPFMMYDFDDIPNGECPGRPSSPDPKREANCRDPYGYCKCMSIGLFQRVGDFYTSPTMKKSLYVNIDRYDGNGICEQFTAYVCQMPYCDPNDPAWDTKTKTDAKDTRGWAGGKGLEPPIRNNEGLNEKDPSKPVAYAGYWTQISEATLGSADCNDDGATNEPFKHYARFDGSDVGYFELAIGGGDWEPGPWEDNELHVITKNGPSMIQAWDGKLDDGTIVNSELKKAGLVYKRPTKTTLFKNSKGRTMMRMDCDGTFGMGIGNGLEFLGRWPFLHPLTSMFDDAIKYVQKCRHTHYGLTFSEDVYRVNWRIWHPESILYKVSQSEDGKRPSIYGIESMYEKSGLRPYNLENFGSVKEFQNSIFKEPMKFDDPICNPNKSPKPEGTCESKADWRINMPSTCTYDMYKDKGLCKIKFTGLASFFNVGNFDVLGEFRRCSAPNEGGLFSGALVMTGPVPIAASPLQWCSSNSDCTNGNVCMDVVSKAKALQDLYGKLPRKVKTKYHSSNAIVMSDRILEDPLAALVYGQKMGAANKCIKKDGTFVTARKILRALGQETDDGKSELKFCIPHFFDKLATDASSVEDDAKNFLTNRLSVVNNGLKIRDMGDNLQATYMYGTDKLSITGDKAAVKADAGKAWQKIEVDIEGGSEDVTCQQTEQAREAFLKQMKETDSKTFKDLSQNDVMVKCAAKTTKTTKAAAAGKKWQTISVDISRGSGETTCKQTDKAREAFLKQLKEKDATAFKDLTVDEVEVSCSETTEKRVAQTLEFSGLTKANVESKKTEITKNIADSLSVAESMVTITSIEETSGRRRRLLLSTSVEIEYDVKVADAAAALALETKMTSASVKDTVVDKVATSTGVPKANIQVEQKAPETKAAGVKLGVAVQIDASTASATKTKLETALGDKSGVAAKLAKEGVETEKNAVVLATDVEQVTAATAATDTVEVTNTAVVMEVEVQVDETTAAETQKKLEESFNDKEKVAEKLGEAGVVKEDGSAIASTDVKDTKVAAEVTQEIDVKAEDLPENVQNIVDEEQKGGYTAVTESLKQSKQRGGGGANGNANSPSPGSSLSEDDILSPGNYIHVTTSALSVLLMACTALLL